MNVNVILLAVFGMLGMTILFPLLAACLSPFQNKGRERKQDSRASDSPIKISILIPAHNEEKSIGVTILSVQAAIILAERSYSGLHCEIIVGADACTDRTTETAMSLGAETIVSSSSLGKWGMLSKLTHAAQQTDWIAFVDAGTIWPENLLVEALPYINSACCVGVAPAYRNPGGGRLESLFWNFERSLKYLEGFCGGPISIHGATILYQAQPVKRVFAKLGDTRWLNDDVVVPLMLRTLNPGHRIKYLSNVLVRDSDHRAAGAGKLRNERFRRVRMVRGNAQWIRGLLYKTCISNPSVGSLAFRRVFRVFWAYWALAMFWAIGGTVTSALNVHPFSVISFSVAALLALYFAVPPVRRWIVAAFASLLAPYFVIRGDCEKGVIWG